MGVPVRGVEAEAEVERGRGSALRPRWVEARAAVVERVVERYRWRLTRGLRFRLYTGSRLGPGALVGRVGLAVPHPPA